MKRFTAAVALVLGVPLSGCVLAIGNTPDDEGKRLKAIEKRLDALEAKCGACMPGQIRMSEGGGMSIQGTDATIVISGPDGKPHVMTLGKEGTNGEMKFEMKEEDEKEGDEQDEKDEQDEMKERK